MRSSIAEKDLEVNRSLDISLQHSSIGNKVNHILHYISKTAAGRSGESISPPLLGGAASDVLCRV